MRLLFLFFSFYFFCDTGSAAIIRVGQNRPYSRIKDALAVAKNGDTLMVYKGLYKEGNINITRSVFLIGVDMPVLDGDKKYEVVSIRASKVTIKGFQVQHSGHASLDDPGGIKVYEASHVLIENNYLFDNFFGIYIQYGKHCQIRNNRIISFGKQEQEIGNGIHCWKSDSLQIIGNNVSGHRDGIYFEFVTHSTIWRNISTGNIRYGLHFMFSNDDAYYSNHFKKNGAGVAVMFTRNVVMTNNTFEENWGDAAYGLLLKEISDCQLSGNRFIRNTAGIFMDGTSRIKMERNVLRGNGWGMKIQANCMDNLVTRNNFLGNTFDVSTNGTLTLNVFKENYWDKYEGYDLNRDNIGDQPYHPLSLYAVIAERTPATMLLYRSFMVTLLDKSEKLLPSLTPENFVDKAPLMNPVNL